MAGSESALRRSGTSNLAASGAVSITEFRLSTQA